jgi:hypothetical protein
MQTVNETSAPETNNNNPTIIAALEQENNRLRANLRTLNARCHELGKWLRRLGLGVSIVSLISLFLPLISALLSLFLGTLVSLVLGGTLIALCIAHVVIAIQINRKRTEIDACHSAIVNNARQIDAIQRAERPQGEENSTDSVSFMNRYVRIPLIQTTMHNAESPDSVSYITYFLNLNIDAPARPGVGENAEKLSGLELNIPDEFICPLSFQIMTNPVYVNAHPGQRFERSWIEYHLSQHNNNPLNREPLSLSELSDDTALKNQIDAYVEEQLQHVATPAMTI